jgi:hypothetical protein
MDACTHLLYRIEDCAVSCGIFAKPRERLGVADRHISHESAFIRLKVGIRTGTYYPWLTPSRSTEVNKARLRVQYRAHDCAIPNSPCCRSSAVYHTVRGPAQSRLDIAPGQAAEGRGVGYLTAHDQSGSKSCSSGNPQYRLRGVAHGGRKEAHVVELWWGRCDVCLCSGL